MKSRGQAEPVASPSQDVPTLEGKQLATPEIYQIITVLSPVLISFNKFIRNVYSVFVNWAL